MNVTTGNSTTGAVSDRGRHFGSFREYVEALKAIGEVQEIEREVNWNLEMGAIIMRTTQNKLPAPLFNKVKDAEAGLRALGAPAAASRQPGLCFARLALMMGMDPHSGGSGAGRGLSGCENAADPAAASRAKGKGSLQAAHLARK